MKIILNEGNSRDNLDSVINHQTDFALIGIGIHRPRRALEMITVAKEEIFLLVWPGHRLANRETVSFPELEGEPIILREKGSMVRDLVLAAFEQKKLRAKVVVEAENITTLIELIKEEEGIGFLPRFIVSQELKTGDLKAIGLVERLHLDGYLVSLKNSYMTEMKKNFSEMLVNYFRKRGMEGGREKKI